MESYLYFAFSIAVIVVIFLLIKKIAGCILKSVILLIVAALLAYVYFNYFKVVDGDSETNVEQIDNWQQRHATKTRERVGVRKQILNNGDSHTCFWKKNQCSMTVVCVCMRCETYNQFWLVYCRENARESRFRNRRGKIRQKIAYTCNLLIVNLLIVNIAFVCMKYKC